MNHRLTITAAFATIATSAVLYPLLASGIWLSEGAMAAICVALAGTLTRLRRLPAALCLAVCAAVLLLYLNVLYAARQSAMWVFPTWSSLRHLWRLSGAGLASVHKYAPPVPASHGILLLTVGGIGIVAVLTDLLAVRLRRPALAGLPLLVLFCVPLSTSSPPGSVGAVLVFGLAVAGFLALLSMDGRERVRLWGRLVTVWQSAHPDSMPQTSRLTAAGRRIGFAAALIALCVPVLLPGRPVQRLLGGGHGPGPGPGGSVSLPDPLAVLNRQLHESRATTVLTYRTSDPSPPYLQVYVLGQLSDSAWTINRNTFRSNARVSSGPMPAAPGLTAAVPGPAVSERISLARDLTTGTPGVSYLPVPYPARSVSIPGDWRVDRGSLMVFAVGGKLGGLQYRVTAKDVNPTPQQLRLTGSPSSAISRYLPVPSAFSGLRPLAREITRHSHTAYGRAVALQHWFTQTGHFTYSLTAAPPHSARALVHFLTISKRGYCQQFAFGMAVLARLLGIPSRVVVGYTQGTFVGGDLWRVTTRDAHAWPELWFQGIGWLRFEPTPDGATGPGQATASAPAYSYASQTAGGTGPAPGSQTAGGTTSPGTAGQHSNLPPGLRNRELQAGKTGGGTAARPRHHPLPVGWMLACLLGLVLVTPRSARSATRRRRWLAAAHDAGRAEAAWRELTDDLTDHGIGCPGSESPRATARRLTGALPLTAAEQACLSRLVDAVERARYARTPAAAGTLRSDVAAVRRAIAKAARPSARWRARLLPASSLARSRSRLQQALGVLGRLDRFLSRVSDQTRAGADSSAATGP